MKLALVGCTGLVGSIMIKVLEERNYPVEIFIPVASERSVGKEIEFKGESYKIIGIEDAIALAPDIAIFSAGGGTSKQWAPRFAEVGTVVIDNSSAWRMDPGKKLIVPEINGSSLTKNDKIIANPNCSTIQMVVALNPLHKKFGLKRIVVSTYQSVTGTGVAGVSQLNDERSKVTNGKRAYPHQIDLNCLPHGGDFADDGYTTEEVKLVDETRKILGDETIGVTATVVRVPVFGGHSESVNAEFKNAFTMEEVKELLQAESGITIQDDPTNNIYPMPLTSEGKDDVFVGRLRIDHSNPNTLNMWVVSDNLRKGAATNAVQIAELLSKMMVVS
ncbi:MAG: aspartate-semialdehyde dehydrogenase [Chitinophagales bacterium]|nr:aspartate-semialdehyde dehydrogenase [Chitinophagales bacterium]